VAFVVVHESVEASPSATEVGEAERVQVGATTGGGATVILVSHFDSPPGPLTVIVYSVVTVIETSLEPVSCMSIQPPVTSPESSFASLL